MKHGLVGWVKNTGRQTVVGVAEGPESEVEHLYALSVYMCTMYHLHTCCCVVYEHVCICVCMHVCVLRVCVCHTCRCVCVIFPE